MAEYAVRIHHEPGDPGGEWGAVVLELPGCFATGATFDELREALTEAVALYLDRPLPDTPARVGELKLLVPA